MLRVLVLALLGVANGFNTNVAAVHQRSIGRACGIACSTEADTTAIRIRKRDRLANAFKGLVRRVKPAQDADDAKEVVSWYDSGTRLTQESTDPVDKKAEVQVTKEGVQSWFDSGIRLTEESEDKQLMQKIKDAGAAGLISYIIWEWAFWGVSIPVCVAGYQAATGHWPDFSSQDDLSKLGAEAFAFVNVARFAVPLRIGLALSTTPWVQDNIVDKFQKEKDGEKVEEKNE